MESTKDGFDSSFLYYIFDVLFASRAIYGLLKAYFAGKFERLRLQEQQRLQRKPVRVYMDGCFDMMHFGHANALRQAKALGDYLVVGLCSDEEIIRHKGPPVMNEKERYAAVASVKWVDEVIFGVPYEVTAEFLDRLIREYHIDYIVHGDDACYSANGQDAYYAVKKAGRFKTIKRTEGVSSTDLVGRMLLCTRDHHIDNIHGEHKVSERTGRSSRVFFNEQTDDETSLSKSSTFLPTTRRLIQFAQGGRTPKPEDKVVYIDGAFDMFHSGHIETLKAAKQLGDFLLVGIHDDHTVNRYKGRNFPIMNLHERTLSVLSCRYVDEVIIGAPWAVTEDMIKTMNISIVCHGTHWDEPHNNSDGFKLDPYAVPKRMGIYKEIPSSSNLSVMEIIDRIVKNRAQFVTRQQKKQAQEQQYLETKHFVQEL
ncbi:hypothetical protein GAYE_SCF61G6520 [Galdieria yellowstonensis]|uniref:ethanolamine-phosphate cytidylyltransferase n=1 Tax=Galdieria yellowstonensis TaxID=3028027 RepID=A0AAV9IMC3_9RHOD|nr:hypothetical protein GAYE_SCF61G6520 [Galdieria yellowstonensis]